MNIKKNFLRLILLSFFVLVLEIRPINTNLLKAIEFKISQILVTICLINGTVKLVNDIYEWDTNEMFRQLMPCSIVLIMYSLYRR